MIFPSQPQKPEEDEVEFSFEPDPVVAFIAESLNEAGFSFENSWLLATRHETVDWHRAVSLLEKGGTELQILKALL